MATIRPLSPITSSVARRCCSVAIGLIGTLALASCSSDSANGTGDSANGSGNEASEAATPSDQATTASASSTTSSSVPARSTTSGPDDPGGATGCQPGDGGLVEFMSDAGGPEVQVRVFVPPNADGPIPVVLNWHGLGSNGTQQAVLSAYETLAADEGFLAVHPTGAQNSWELAQFDTPGRDDLAMVDDVIDRLVSQFCADPTRIYSTGLSNGGFFTALLVCERADRIAAAVSVAGVSHPDGCSPSRPVPFIAFHGTDDAVVTFDGGRSTLESGAETAGSRAFFDQSMPEEFAEFAADFGCGADPESATVGDEVTRHDYLGCDDDVALSFYEIAGGGHTWPGSPLGPVLTGALGLTTDQVSATVDGWAFMRQFSSPAEAES